MAPTRGIPSGDLVEGGVEERERERDKGGWKRGGCIETITPLLEAAVRVINDRIGRGLFIYHRSGSSSCPLAGKGVCTVLKREIFSSPPFFDPFCFFFKLILNWDRIR